jgi:hypothetical protein
MLSEHLTNTKSKQPIPNKSNKRPRLQEQKSLNDDNDTRSKAKAQKTGNSGAVTQETMLGQGNLPTQTNLAKLESNACATSTTMTPASVSRKAESQESACGNFHQNGRRRGRIYSDSAMDFVPPEHTSDNSNILTRLVQRSTYGGLMFGNSAGRGRRRNVNIEPQAYSSVNCPSWMWPSKWKKPSWVSLALGNVRNVDHLAWDETGVLLAVATDSMVSIYDWDMVHAADIQGRRDRARDCHGSEWRISPILQFLIPSRVSKLIWNRFHPDELVVGLR